MRAITNHRELAKVLSLLGFVSSIIKVECSSSKRSELSCSYDEPLLFVTRPV